MTASPVFSELSRIAASVAGRVSEVDMRPDVEQEAWLKFIQYKPRTRTGAWLMANSARNTLWRRERYQRRLRGMPIEELRLQRLEGQRKAGRTKQPRFTREELMERNNRATRERYHNNLERSRAATLERVHKHRRKELP